MIDIKKNNETNEKLSKLYLRYNDAFLAAYTEAFKAAPPPRINEFGIINTQKYDADNGILFIGKETNGWSDEDFKRGILFREWMRDISLNGLGGRGHVKRHPTVWYNMGRWAESILRPEATSEELAAMKQEALRALGCVAITNINKVRGLNVSKEEYAALAYSDVAGTVLREEIDILKPKVIITCGNFRVVCYHLQNTDIWANGTVVIEMPHPAARLSSKKMIDDLKWRNNNYIAESPDFEQMF